MPTLTMLQAADSIDRLRAALESVEAAGRKSAVGTPSTLDLLDQWRVRITSGDMDAEALPTLYARQARRHGRTAAGPIIASEETRLRRVRGLPTEYGAPWYYGRQRPPNDVQD